MKTAHFLYELEFPNGKKYLGISRINRLSRHNRFAEHAYHARRGARNYPVYNAIRKYGFENVKKRILVYGDADYIRALEISAISSFNTLHPNGYNLTMGGEIAPSTAPAIREKIKQSKLTHWKNPEYRAKMIASAKGRKCTPEQNAKNSRAKKAQWEDTEYRKKCTDSHKGKKASDETKKKMSIAGKGHPNRNYRKMLINAKGQFVRAL